MFLIIKKLARMMLLLIGVSFVAFLLVSISPIDPLQANLGQSVLGTMSGEQIEKLESYWGVEESIGVRYINWGKDFIKGEMGISLLYRRPVKMILLEKLSNSLLLLGIAWIISGTVGFFLGGIAGINRRADKIIQSICIFLTSTPGFWIGLLLLMIFSVGLKILPIGLSVPIGMEAIEVTIGDRIRHAILPALTLSITGIADIALHTREKMIEVMQSDYVIFAKARGENSKQILIRHGIRNIILPAMTMQFASIGEIFGGSILVEQIFSYPGLGQAAVTAGLGSDIPLLLGITMICAAVVFIGNFTADILYEIIDPRMRRRGK